MNKDVSLLTVFYFYFKLSLHFVIFGVSCLLAVIFGPIAVALTGEPYSSLTYLFGRCGLTPILLRNIFDLDIGLANEEKSLVPPGKTMYHYPSAVYVCNHQSSLDLIIVSCILPRRTVIISKRESFLIPVFGWFLWMSDSLALNRNNPGKAVEQLKFSAKKILQKQESVLIFPEGTRSRSVSSDLLPFKKGAFHLAKEANIPIIPIVFDQYSHIYHSPTYKLKNGRINATSIEK